MEIFLGIIAFIGRIILRTIIFEVVLFLIGMVILTPLYLFDTNRIRQKHSPEFISFTGLFGTVFVLLILAIII
jgi:hypothetical protein